MTTPLKNAVDCCKERKVDPGRVIYDDGKVVQVYFEDSGMLLQYPKPSKEDTMPIIYRRPKV